MTDICASPLYSNQTICEVMGHLNDVIESADVTSDLAIAALSSLQTNVEDGITAMDAIDYVPGTAGIDDSFVAVDDVQGMPDFSSMGPTTPTLPGSPTSGTLTAVGAAPIIPDGYVVQDADDLLIDSGTFDAIFTREAERRAAVGVKAERDAMYNTSRMGIGGVTAALSIGLKAAQETTNLDVSDVAREKAIAEGGWLREDVKTLHGLHVQNWPQKPTLDLEAYKAEEGMKIEGFSAQEGANSQGYEATIKGLTAVFDSEVKMVLGALDAETARYKAFLEKKRVDIAEEAERRGWSEMQMKTALEEADRSTAYAIEKTKYILESLRMTTNTTAEIIGALASSMYSAANFNLSGSGSQSVTETV